jgi:hypothetical protein
MRRLFLPLVFALHAVTCAGASPRPTSLPATCVDVCNVMRTFACPGAQPTTAGASCEMVCTNFQHGPAPWDLRCRALAKSCASANSCEAK